MHGDKIVAALSALISHEGCANKIVSKPVTILNRYFCVVIECSFELMWLAEIEFGPHSQPCQYDFWSYRYSWSDHVVYVLSGIKCWDLITGLRQ